MKRGKIILLLSLLLITIAGCGKSKEEPTKELTIETEEVEIPDNNINERYVVDDTVDMVDLDIPLKLDVPTDVKNKVKEGRYIQLNSSNVMSILEEFLSNNGYEYRGFYESSIENKGSEKLEKYKKLAGDNLGDWEIIDFPPNHFIIKIGFNPYSLTEEQNNKFNHFLSKIEESFFKVDRNCVLIYEMGDLSEDINNYLKYIVTNNGRGESR